MIEYKIFLASSAVCDYYIPKWRKHKSFLFFKWKTKWNMVYSGSAYGFKIFTNKDSLNRWMKENNIDLKLQKRKLKLNKLNKNHLWVTNLFPIFAILLLLIILY